MNQKKLFKHIKKMKKSEILELLIDSYDSLGNKDRRLIYGDLYENITSKNTTPRKLLNEIKNFYIESINGVYYASFNVNSKNFMNIPDETDDWFSKLGKYLDKCSALVKSEEYKIANKGFEILYELISRMEDGEDIIFADEYGTWMITSKEDYDKYYIECVSKIEKATVFAEKMMPLLRRDSVESFSGKIYQKIKGISSKDQKLAVEKKIQTEKIRIS